MDIVGFITGLGLIAILLVVFAESGLLIGFLFPGDSLLFASGLLINSGVLDINIHLFIILVFIAAVLGDNVGYTFGREVGHKLFSRQNTRFFKQEYLLKSQKFYEKHGAYTIVLARFIPVIRTFAPIVAGSSKMNYKTFLKFNMLGALLWGASNTYLGFYLGSLFKQLGLDIEMIILPLMFVIIVVSLIPPIYHLFKNKESRTIFTKEFQKQLKQLKNKFKK